MGLDPCEDFRGVRCDHPCRAIEGVQLEDHATSRQALEPTIDDLVNAGGEASKRAAREPGCGVREALQLCRAGAKSFDPATPPLARCDFALKEGDEMPQIEGEHTLVGVCDFECPQGAA